jgi:hypothetical protein
MVGSGCRGRCVRGRKGAGKYSARGEDKTTVEEVERMKEQYGCLRRKTRGNFCSRRWRGRGIAVNRSSEEQSSARGLVCNFRKLQGLLGKEEFNHYSRAQIKM